MLDGKIVVYNDVGQPDFGLPQERRGRYETHRRSAHRDEPFDDLPVHFLAFDLLQLGVETLLRAPYDERRQQLESLPMPEPYRVAVVSAFTFTELEADRQTVDGLLAHVAATGHERLVAKNHRAPYTPGKRTDAWLKHPLTQTSEGVVCGWREGQGRFTGMVGGLLLGAHDPDSGDLVYIGDVGTGMHRRTRPPPHPPRTPSAEAAPLRGGSTAGGHLRGPLGGSRARRRGRLPASHPQW